MKKHLKMLAAILLFAGAMTAALWGVVVDATESPEWSAYCAASADERYCPRGSSDGG